MGKRQKHEIGATGKKLFDRGFTEHQRAYSRQARKSHKDICDALAGMLTRGHGRDLDPRMARQNRTELLPGISIRSNNRHLRHDAEAYPAPPVFKAEIWFWLRTNREGSRLCFGRYAISEAPQRRWLSVMELLTRPGRDLANNKVVSTHLRSMPVNCADIRYRRQTGRPRAILYCAVKPCLGQIGALNFR